MTNISAYIIGAAALGATAVWIVGLKAEPVSAPVAAAATHPGEGRSVTAATGVPAARSVHNPFSAAGAHWHRSTAPRAGTAPSSAQVADGATTVRYNDPDQTDAGDAAAPDHYGRDYAYQTAPMAAPASTDTQPTDAQARLDRLVRQPATSRTTVRHTDGHLDITIVGSAPSSNAAPASVETTVLAPVPAAVPASYGEQQDCTLYRGGNAYARLVLIQRECKF